MLYRLALQKCRDWVLDLKAHLRDTGEAFTDGMVNVSHDDGTQYSFQNARAVTYHVPDSDHEFLVVLTEHHRDHIFPRNEISRYAQWSPAPWGIPRLDENFQVVEDDLSDVVDAAYEGENP